MKTKLDAPITIPALEELLSARYELDRITGEIEAEAARLEAEQAKSTEVWDNLFKEDT